MKIIFFGNSKYSRIVAQTLNQKYPLSQIVTIPDRPLGRKKTLTPSPVKQYALENNIDLIETDILDKDIIHQISQVEPDFLVVADYGLILPKTLLDTIKKASLNVHHSLLPKYRGPSPAPTAILNGDKVSGVTIIEMSEEVDAGEIVAQRQYSLTEDETTDSLLTKLNSLGGELLLEVIPKYFEGSVKTSKQDESKVSFTDHLKKEDGYFDLPAGRQGLSTEFLERLDRMIRAYYPWPNAWTRWSFDSAQDKKGKIVKFLPGGMIQMEGKKPVSLKDFLNGHPDFPIKDL